MFKHSGPCHPSLQVKFLTWRTCQKVFSPVTGRPENEKDPPNLVPDSPRFVWHYVRKPHQWLVSYLVFLHLQETLISTKIEQKLLYFWPQLMVLQKWARIVFWRKKKKKKRNIFAFMSLLCWLLRARDSLAFCYEMKPPMTVSAVIWNSWWLHSLSQNQMAWVL